MSEDVKSRAQERFGPRAQNYVRSASHASGDDLERLVALAQPAADWLALDVAAGGGHTALKFAPHVARVVASDLTPPMLEAARSFIRQKGADNVIFSAGDAEMLPFKAETFDLVTCRIAPHHFPDCFRFVQECARVLKPGGRLLVEDQLVPDDERAARYLDAFERLRDPSHHRVYAEYEWRGLLLDAGFIVEQVEQFIYPERKLLPWAQMQDCPPEVIERLQVMLAQAPQAVAEWMNPRCAGTPDATFQHHFIIIMGRKGMS